MGGSNNSPRFVLATPLGIIALCMGTTAHAAVAGVAWRSHVSTTLLTLYDSKSHSGSTARFDSSGRVQVDVHYDCALNTPTAGLKSAGLSPGASVKVTPLCVVEGWVAPTAVPQIAVVAGVTRVKIPAYVSHLHPKMPGSSAQPQATSSNAIDSNGLTIIHADQFVSQTGVNGTGVTVGVQSEGVYSLSVIQGRHELPSVKVLTPSGASGSSQADEGTVLLEEVHAAAPGASLAFCEPQTAVEYASCLGQLIAAGATILVDDVVFPNEDLMSSDNTDAQAVQQLLAQNPAVALFTVVGNNNGSYWEGHYSPVALASPLSCPSNGHTQVDHYAATFNTSPSQTLTVTAGGSFPLTFAWADPFAQNSSNFDVYWIDNSNNANTACFSTAASADTLITPTLGLNAGTYTIYIATPDATLAGKFLKLWFGGDGLTSISTPTAGSVVSPQAFASGAITIGAVNGSDGVGNSIETFSSLGPITVAFPSLNQIHAPVLVAPDGIKVDATGTYFASLLFPDGNFYGTSAAVPNAGAVAALLRSAFPALTVSQLKTALQAGATQLGSVVPDDTFGYGRIDAIGALGTLPVPTITSLPDVTVSGSATSDASSFTVSGTGNLHFSVTSNNTGLIPSSIVAAGAPGVTIVPSTCGVSTLTCTVSVTPRIGVSGTANVMVSALDGANRSAPASMTVTSNDPAPAPPPTVTVSSGSGGGGGVLGWWEILSVALLASHGVSGRFFRTARIVRRTAEHPD